MSRARTVYKDYYYLSKPGIIRGNVITAFAGYIFGSAWDVDGSVLVGLLSGLTLLIAGACASNNYLDRGIDSKMKRTATRAIAAGRLSSRQALIFAGITTALGIFVLVMTQNALTTLLASFAWFAYVVMYGYAKRVTVHGTLIGCVSGSIPMVAGYTAATGRFDLIAIQLTLLMTTWQMAHFYGIALFRLKDYRAANIPVMPAIYGARSTKLQSVGYMLLLLIVVLWMGLTNTLTASATVFLLIIILAWQLRAKTLWSEADSAIWGRSIFLFSLVVMIGISIALVANPLLPQ